jgi:hypothetical protein
VIFDLPRRLTLLKAETLQLLILCSYWFTFISLKFL